MYTIIFFFKIKFWSFWSFLVDFSHFLSKNQVRPRFFIQNGLVDVCKLSKTTQHAQIPPHRQNWTENWTSRSKFMLSTLFRRSADCFVDFYRNRWHIFWESANQNFASISQFPIERYQTRGIWGRWVVLEHLRVPMTPNWTNDRSWTWFVVENKLKCGSNDKNLRFFMFFIYKSPIQQFVGVKGTSAKFFARMTHSL